MSYQYPPDPFKEAHEVINSLVAYYSDRNSDQLKEIQHLVDDITNGAAQKEALVQQNIRGRYGVTGAPSRCSLLLQVTVL